MSGRLLKLKDLIVKIGSDLSGFGFSGPLALRYLQYA
jgi:hypothetical protein